MGRNIKQGLDYFPLYTDFFTNSKKIKALRRARGSMGIAVYLNLLCRIYMNGYYYEFVSFKELCTDIAEEIASEREQIRQVASRVGETLHYMIEVGLIDRSLFEMNVISSTAVQEQYLERVTAAKRKVQIDVYSLLGQVPEEVHVGDCTQKNGVSSEEKGISSEEKGISSEEMKQSKSKSKSKVKNTLYTYSFNARESEVKSAYGEFGNVMLSKQDICRLEEVIPQPFLDAYIDRFSRKLVSHKYKFNDHCRTLLEWWRDDKKKFMENYTEDCDE